MLTYKDIPQEQFEYIFNNYRKFSFNELAEQLNYSKEDVRNILATWRDDFNHYPLPRMKYKDFSESWKQEVIEFYSNHSLNNTLLYFFTQGKFIRQFLEERGIREHTRAETLEFTHIENHGSHEAYVEAMVANTIKTSQERYGVDNYAKTQESKDKQVTKFIENYGVDNPMKCNEVKQTYMDNMLEKRGVCWPQQDPAVLQKRLDTCDERYGGHGWGSKQLYETFLDTMEQKYGARHWIGSPELVAKVNAKCQATYGVDWPCLYPEVRNAFSNDSGPNRLFAELLDKNNIKYQREFGLGTYSFDFKIGNTLVEIDPAPTHNSTWNPFGGEPFTSKYHHNKSKFAESKGYRCIHVWDWDNIDLIITQLNNRPRVYARNCEVKQIDNKLSNEFLIQHHLQGKVTAEVCFGLFYKDELVSVMTFGKPRYNKNYEWELLRYASSYEVVGGAEKLFKFFVNNNKPQSVISYCDKSKFTGAVYPRLGFKHVATNISKHWYNMSTEQHITDNLLRQRGFDQLFGTNFGKGTSNEQLMLDHKFIEIYDAGQATYVWKNS